MTDADRAIIGVAREGFARLDARFDRLHADLEQVDRRLVTLLLQTGGIRGELSILQDIVAEQALLFDRIEKRLGRIEQRITSGEPLRP